jgi:hypothetical protein
MAQNDIYQDASDADPGAVQPGAETPPDFSAVLSDAAPEDAPDTEAAAGSADSGRAERKFPEVTKRFLDTPHTGLMDPNYYKIALSGEGDIAQRVHRILQKYIAATDPKDRGVFRQQISAVFWDYLAGVARKSSENLPDAKKFLLRFGILHPTFLNAEARAFFSKVVVENTLSVPIYYLDEWFRAIGSGEIRNSATDEVGVSKNADTVRFQQLLNKARGRREGARGLLAAKNEERINLDNAFTERVGAITEHEPMAELPTIFAPYTDTQKRIFGEIHDLMKQMITADRDIDVFVKDFYQAEADIRNLQDKVDEGDAAVDPGAVGTEFNTIRQMAKMTIGRQGNVYPILTSEYFHSGPNDVGIRENVVSILAHIESIDAEAFVRVFKNQPTRIIPFVILIPSYGDMGVCWEPFDRFNRATSRGRIAVPMYPKNLALAELSAVADLRWQVAKEKASFYWMEDGLTGNYYQWFSAQKLKGDVKGYFIQDYITWVTRESEGIQKLDKEMRGIFWRCLPFTQAIKDKLKGRSLIYQELYQRDLNRARSDGY